LRKAFLSSAIRVLAMPAMAVNVYTAASDLLSSDLEGFQQAVVQRQRDQAARQAVTASRAKEQESSEVVLRP
jgi:hypothetical protein